MFDKAKNPSENFAGPVTPMLEVDRDKNMKVGLTTTGSRYSYVPISKDKREAVKAALEAR